MIKSSIGRYKDCLQVIKANSRDCDYVNNHADELEELIEAYFELAEKHDKLEREYMELLSKNEELKNENYGMKTTIRNQQEKLERYWNYRNR